VPEANPRFCIDEAAKQRERRLVIVADRLDRGELLGHGHPIAVPPAAINGSVRMRKQRTTLARARTLTALSVTVGVLAIAAAQSAANTTQLTIMQDDTELHTDRMDQRLDEMKALGADVVKLRLPWRYIAPGGSTKPNFDATDPNAYPTGAWDSYDAIVRGIVARHMRPYITITGPAPDWASSHHDPLDNPAASEFAKFVQAAGSRYSGNFQGGNGNGYNDPLQRLPRVSIWSLWNEPNLASWLKPQYSGGVPRSPAIYRKLAYATQDGLTASGHSSDTFLIAELLPFARSGRTGVTKVRPIQFLREMACVDRHYRPYKGSAAKKRGCTGRFRKIPGTGIAYHPYTYAGGPDVPQRNSDDASIGELGRVARAVDALSRRNRLVGGHLPIWITEFGFQTDPPDVFQSPIKKVPGFMGEAEWLAYKSRRVLAFSQYPLVDDALGKGAQKYAGFQSGLRFIDGTEKKGVYQAFEMPFYVRRRGSNLVEIFGGWRAADPGTAVTVQSRTGRGQWTTLPGGALLLGRGGYFERRFRVSASGRQFRFLAGKTPSRTATAAKG
jgi:hypothetical protein